MAWDKNERGRLALSIDSAYRSGSLQALLEALGNPPDFPNCRHAPELGVGDRPLEYAIYWSPLPFITKLLDLGAAVNYADDDGFPSLIAALSSGRRDLHEIVALLLDRGADVGQRGVNDWTPLHYAVAERDIESVRQLLAYGADPALATRIDDRTSPLEDAEAIGFNEAVAMMRQVLAAGGRHDD